MKEQYLIEIELPIWADPQGNVILEKSREYCYIFFDCWEDNEPTYSDYIGKIHFKNAWAVKSLDVEFYDIYPKGNWKYKSSICIMENSLWMEEMILIRRKYYDNWADENVYKHFHFVGHDNYFDILAESYTVEKVLKSEIQYYQKLWIE